MAAHGPGAAGIHTAGSSFFTNSLGVGTTNIVAIGSNPNGLVIRSFIIVAGAGAAGAVIGNAAASKWLRSMVASANLYDEAKQMPLNFPPGLAFDVNLGAAAVVFCWYDIK